MSYKLIRIVAMNSILLLFMATLKGQVGSSIILIEQPEPLVFSSQRDFVNGVETCATLAVVNTSNPSSWHLLIKTTGDLEQAGNSIPISLIEVKANRRRNCRGRGRSISLSRRNKCIATNRGRSTRIDYVELTFRAKGGKRFLQPSGRYSTSILFTLVLD